MRDVVSVTLKKPEILSSNNHVWSVQYYRQNLCIYNIQFFNKID